MNNDNKTPEEIDRLELLAASYACDYRDSPNKTNGIPDSYLVYSIAYDAFLDGYKAAMDQLADADKVMPQWISVNERLPEYDQLALLWQSEMKAQFVGRRRDSGLEFFLYYWECTEDFFEIWKEIYFPKLMHEGVVTHWMPLPAPPKEEK